jgi:hypothetical protein
MGGVFWDIVLLVLEMSMNNFEIVRNVIEQREEVLVLREFLEIFSFRSK